MKILFQYHNIQRCVEQEEGMRACFEKVNKHGHHINTVEVHLDKDHENSLRVSVEARIAPNKHFHKHIIVMNHMVLNNEFSGLISQLQHWVDAIASKKSDHHYEPGHLCNNDHDIDFSSEETE